MSIKTITGCIGCGICVKTYPMDVIRLKISAPTGIVAYNKCCEK